MAPQAVFPRSSPCGASSDASHQHLAHKHLSTKTLKQECAALWVEQEKVFRRMEKQTTFDMRYSPVAETLSKHTGLGPKLAELRKAQDDLRLLHHRLSSNGNRSRTQDPSLSLSREQQRYRADLVREIAALETYPLDQYPGLATRLHTVRENLAVLDAATKGSATSAFMDASTLQAAAVTRRPSQPSLIQAAVASSSTFTSTNSRGPHGSTSAPATSHVRSATASLPSANATTSTKRHALRALFKRKNS